MAARRPTLTFDDDAMQSGEEKAEGQREVVAAAGPRRARDYTVLRRRTRPELSKSAREGWSEPNGHRSRLGAVE
jgi:hypothetical protein